MQPHVVRRKLCPQVDGAEFDGEHDTEEPAISLDEALSGARPASESGLKRLAGRKT